MNYQLQKEKGELELEKFNRENNLDKLAEELDAGQVLETLEFYFGGLNEIFSHIFCPFHRIIQRQIY